MSKSIRSRRIVALAAAYVVALQALLLPLSVAAGSPFTASLCAASAPAGGSPSGHDGGCPCAAGCGMQCCVQTLAGAPHVTIGFDVTHAIAWTPPPTLEPIVRGAVHSPQIPRAPPAV